MTAPLIRALGAVRPPEAAFHTPAGHTARRHLKNGGARAVRARNLLGFWPAAPPWARRLLAKPTVESPPCGTITPGFRFVRLLLAMALSTLALASPAPAQTCTVPGSHATIQQAIDDPGCATITLAAQTYAESVNIPRSLTMVGPGTGGAVVQGLLRVVGAGTQVTLQDLRVENGCPVSALRAVAGAEVTGTNLEVERSAGFPCPPSIVFQDGFESGDTTAWSATVP